MNAVAIKRAGTVKTPDDVMADFRELLVNGCFTKELVGLNAVGLENFNQTGFPGRKSEKFTYLDVSDLAKAGFHLRKEPSQTTPSQVEAQLLPSTHKSRVVFVDGIYMEHLSDISAIRDQVELLPLSEAFTQFPEIKDTTLQRAIHEDDPIANLNTAFTINGAHLRIKDGEQAQAPIEILFLAARYKAYPLFTAPRLVIDVGRGAKVDFIIKNTKEYGSYLHNSVMDVSARESSDVNFYHISLHSGPAWRFFKLNVDQYAKSSVKLVNVSTGSRISRYAYDWNLKEPGATMEIRSLATLSNKAKNHKYATVRHQAPGCSSRLLFKNVINDEARSSVDSTVIVEPGASGSFSEQLIRNLLVSDKGRADNKPNLMIHADDVQCSHGATIGQLDEEILFYFMSRGLTRDEAARSLLNAFAREVTNSIKEPYAAAVVDETILQRRGE
ncbi:MAG: SufD family Fe-S cluster assembly protein [Nitrospinota bacterium]|nr:SufD family Fe-S cluster assembly protein [Nitrospinota bacterium]